WKYQNRQSSQHRRAEHQRRAATSLKPAEEGSPRQRRSRRNESQHRPKADHFLITAALTPKKGDDERHISDITGTEEPIAEERRGDVRELLSLQRSCFVALRLVNLTAGKPRWKQANQCDDTHGNPTRRPALRAALQDERYRNSSHNDRHACARNIQPDHC